MPSIFRIIRTFLLLGIGLLIFLTLQYFSGAAPVISRPSLPKLSDLPSYQDAKDKFQQSTTDLLNAFRAKQETAESKALAEAAKQAELQPTTTTASTKSTHAVGPGTGYPDGYIEQAHKLESADDFLGHFKAVTQIPGISMKTAKASCDWDANEHVNFQYSEDTEWVKKERTDGELDVHRREWHKFILNDLIPYKDHPNWEGKGIVIVAGGAKGREQVKVILRALAKIGSSIPVEVAFWDTEITKSDQEDMLTVSKNVFFNDLNASSSQNIFKTDYSAFVHNYQLKTAAVINSRFAEVLLLDSDNVPVIQPESLFESGIYKEYGTVFWPDIARTRPNNPIWGITNTKCKKDEFEQESGQVLVNKHKFFYHLQFSAWMGTGKNGEYYSRFLLGDKDMFRFAWHALRTPYGKPTKWVKTVGMVHESTYCGHSFAQHHPDFWNGSIAFIHAGLTKLMPKDFLVWQRTSQGGIFQNYQAAEKEEDPNTTQRVGLKIDELKYWSGKPESIKFVQCNDMYEVPSKQLDEVLPKYDAFFTEIGGYKMLEEQFGGKEP